MGRRPRPAASRSSSARRGRACGRSSAGRATRRSRSRSAGKVESLNVSGGGGGAPLRGTRQRTRRWLTRRSTSSTATTSSTRAAFAARDELVDPLASFVAGRGARGIVVFDGRGDERAIGRLEVRYASDADDAARTARGREPSTRGVCLVSSDAPCGGTSGQRGAQGRIAGASSRSSRSRQHAASTAARAGGRVGDRPIRTPASGSSACAEGTRLDAKRRAQRGEHKP